MGETFHLDLEGMSIIVRYIEVDPPRRMLLRWDRQGTDADGTRDTNSPPI